MKNLIYKFLYWFLGVIGNPIYIYKLYISELKAYQRKLTWCFLELQSAEMSLRVSLARKPNRKNELALMKIGDVLKKIDGYNRVIRIEIAQIESLTAITEAFKNLDYDAAQEADQRYAAKKQN